VPCIMRWPGKIPAGSGNDEITGIIDMLPTFCAIAGVDVPADRVIDGRNILPYMLDQKVSTPIHDSFIVPGSTIRYGDWKVFVSAQGPGGKGNRGDSSRQGVKAGALFNLRNDIGEATDLSAQHPEIVKRLEERMTDFVDTLRAHTREIGYIDGYDKDKVQAEMRNQKAEKGKRVR
jgi:arylsulfatase A-like enzyme